MPSEDRKYQQKAIQNATLYSVLWDSCYIKRNDPIPRDTLQLLYVTAVTRCGAFEQPVSLWLLSAFSGFYHADR